MYLYMCLYNVINCVCTHSWLMEYIVRGGEELSSVFLNSYLVSVLLGLRVNEPIWLPTAADQSHPKGSFEVQTLQTATYQCLETFHMQVLSRAGDGWHVWIWLELLLEPEILGKARGK